MVYSNVSRKKGNKETRKQRRKKSSKQGLVVRLLDFVCIIRGSCAHSPVIRNGEGRKPVVVEMVEESHAVGSHSRAGL